MLSPRRSCHAFMSFVHDVGCRKLELPANAFGANSTFAAPCNAWATSSRDNEKAKSSMVGRLHTRARLVQPTPIGPAIAFDTPAHQNASSGDVRTPCLQALVASSCRAKPIFCTAWALRNSAGPSICARGPAPNRFKWALTRSRSHAPCQFCCTMRSCDPANPSMR